MKNKAILKENLIFRSKTAKIENISYIFMMGVCAVTKAQKYLNNLINIIERINGDQGDNIEAAARLMSDNLCGGGRVHA